jgi:hypothetical protein
MLHVWPCGSAAYRSEPAGTEGPLVAPNRTVIDPGFVTPPVSLPPAPGPDRTRAKGVAQQARYF